MILQSEIDQINSHKRVKILLIILTALAVAVVVYVVIRVGKEDAKFEPVMMIPKTETVEIPPAEEVSQRLEELSKVSEGSTPPPQPSPEEIQKQLEVLSEASDGMTPLPSPQEEVVEKLRILNAK
ncbi:MAG: hypothetical protein QG606_424 [Patescibacteria group bacterium]|jgi:hypothetical protein|nr:hypothetical protein [Patescibacteria group bacterium]